MPAAPQHSAGPSAPMQSVLWVVLLVYCTPLASRGGGGVSLGCQSPTRTVTCTRMYTRTYTHAQIYAWKRGSCVCVCARPLHTSVCTHAPGRTHLGRCAHGTCTGRRGDGAGHLQALRDTAATTKGGGAPSRTRGAGAQHSETGRTVGNPTWGGPHTGRGCLTSPGPTRSAPTLGPRTEFCASGSLFLGNETFPKGIVVP